MFWRTLLLTILYFFLGGLVLILFFNDVSLRTGILLALGLMFISASLATRQACDREIEKERSEVERERSEKTLAERGKEEAERERTTAKEETVLWRQTLIERGQGFPSLMRALSIFDEKKDQSLENTLKTKKHPAVKASELIRKQAQRRREAEFKWRTTESIIEYYESMAPFLIDLKDEVIDLNEEAKYQDYSQEERADPVTDFMTKEEYRKLPRLKKNELALQRFKGRPKSKRLIGKMYERYIGYLYETLGYTVDYYGIYKGYEDLGRDLICHQNGEFVVIQCKCWSQFKTIYEKHIFNSLEPCFSLKMRIHEIR